MEGLCVVSRGDFYCRSSLRVRRAYAGIVKATHLNRTCNVTLYLKNGQTLTKLADTVIERRSGEFSELWRKGIMVLRIPRDQYSYWEAFDV